MTDKAVAIAQRRERFWTVLNTTVTLLLCAGIVALGFVWLGFAIASAQCVAWSWLAASFRQNAKDAIALQSKQPA